MSLTKRFYEQTLMKQQARSINDVNEEWAEYMADDHLESEYEDRFADNGIAEDDTDYNNDGQWDEPF